MIPDLATSTYLELSSIPERMEKHKQEKEELRKRKDEENAERQRAEEELRKKQSEEKAERQRAEAEMRKRQDEIKAEQQRVEAELKIRKREEQLDKLATDYCSERKSNSRTFLTGSIVVKSDGNIDTNTAKKGPDLSHEECRQIVAAIFVHKKGSLSDPPSKEVMNVIEGKIAMGMDRNDVLYSLGLPSNVNTTNYGYGVMEQWIYYKNRSAYDFSAYYIYLDNGKVTTYQDF